jgi:hypothetical protein
MERLSDQSAIGDRMALMAPKLLGNRLDADAFPPLLET